MKNNKVLIIVFLVLATVLLYFIFLSKNQNLNFFPKKYLPTFKNEEKSQTQMNQVGNQQQSEIPMSAPVEDGLSLQLLEPKPKEVFKSSQITVSGKTAPLAEVYLNDRQTMADNSGNFSFVYNLDEGENLLTIVANDAFGNYAEKEITVFLETSQ